MIEKKIIETQKQEFKIKEYIKNKFEYISDVKVERIPLGEKVVIKSGKPRTIKKEDIEKLLEVLKNDFKLENPKIEIVPIENFFLDAECVAEYIKKALERYGPLSFKVYAYRALEKIKKAGAIGAEIRLSGKLPSERARTWRFHFGYMIKSGKYREELVDYAKKQAFTIPGVIGIKVSIIKSKEVPDKIE